MSLILRTDTIYTNPLGAILQIKDNSLLAPTSLSFFLIFGTYLLAGFLHPQDYKCFPMVLVYIVMIPCMYLFLVIYCTFNLHVVSWGTREVPQKNSGSDLKVKKKQAEEEAKTPELEQTQESGILGDKLTRGSSNLGQSARTEGSEEKNTKPHVKKDEINNPQWIERSDQVKNGPKMKLSNEETRFWCKMIEKYLKPLEKNVMKEKQQAAGLIRLRNQAVYIMIMLNGLLIIALFSMQLNKDSLSIEWPLSVAANKKPLMLEPLGYIFLIVSAVVMVLQLIGNQIWQLMPS